MPHQCPFPVHSTDNRCCYRTGSAPGFTLCLALVIALSCYAGFSYAASIAPPHTVGTTVGTVASGSMPGCSHPDGPVIGG